MSANSQLPFTRKFQMGLLVTMIRDYEFLKLIIEDLKPEYIDAGVGSIKLLKIINYLHSVLKKPLTIDIVRNQLHKLEKEGILTEPQVSGMNELLDLGLQLTPSEIDYVKAAAFEFIKRQIIAQAVSESIELLEKNHLDSVYDKIISASKKTLNTGNSFGYNYVTESVKQRYENPPRMDIWESPFPSLNKHLDGGFAKGESYTVLASTGRGKTALLCNLSTHAQKLGKNLLFITLEMSEGQISQRHDSILSGFSCSEIAGSKEMQNLLQQEISKLESGFYIKYFPANSLTINGLDNYLERFRNEVFVPDVVILDWLGLIAPPKAANSESKRHELVSEIAQEFTNLTRKYQFTGITSQQTNRSAAAQSTYSYDAVSESFASLFSFDAVIGLGASEDAKNVGKRYLKMLKNRFGNDGVTVNLIGDLPGTPLTFRFREETEEDTLEDV